MQLLCSNAERLWWATFGLLLFEKSHMYTSASVCERILTSLFSIISNRVGERIDDYHGRDMDQDDESDGADTVDAVVAWSGSIIHHHASSHPSIDTATELTSEAEWVHVFPHRAHQEWETLLVFFRWWAFSRIVHKCLGHWPSADWSASFACLAFRVSVCVSHSFCVLFFLFYFSLSLYSFLIRSLSFSSLVSLMLLTRSYFCCWAWLHRTLPSFSLSLSWSSLSIRVPLLSCLYTACCVFPDISYSQQHL